MTFSNSVLEEMMETFGVSKDGSKSIKSIIYNLATTGNLVPQIPEETHSPEVVKLINKDEVLHEIRSGWLNLKLSACAEIYNGNSTSAAEKALMEKHENGLNYIATKDVGYGFQSIEYETGLKIGTEKNNFKIAQVNSILICLEGGSAGKKMGILSEDVAFGNKLFAVVCKEWIQPKFLLMYFLSSKFQIDFRSKMSGIIGGISKANFSSIQIPVPPLAEQNRIIDRVESLIAICDALQVAQTDQRRFNGLLRRSAIDAVSTAQTPEELQISWNRIQDNWSDLVRGLDGLDDLRDLILGIAFSGLLTRTSNFPLDEWEPTTLGVLCDVRDGTHDSPRKATIGYPLVTSKNLKKGLVDLENSYLISESDYQEISKRSRVDKYDVLISMIGTVGQVAIVKDQPEYAIKNVGLIKTGSELLSGFIGYYLISPQAKSHINIASSGGVQKFLSLGKLRALPIKIPNPQIQEQIVLLLDRLMSVCEELEKNTIQANMLADRFTQSVLANSL